MQEEIIWRPQEGPQAHLVDCPIEEIFYGGARGGGKTDGMIGKNAIKAGIYGKHQKGIFVRKELPQLEDAIERCKEIYLPMKWSWAEQKKIFTAPNGATLKFRPLERLVDAEKQQGKNFTDIYFEELTNYSDPGVYNRMRGTLRSAQGIPCQLHGTGNPGGGGHQWVKSRFIDPDPAGYKVIEEELPNGAKHHRVFIPAKLWDNKLLIENDPNYENNLYMSGSKELVRAWLLGDWNIVEGAFFDCWSPKMVHRPFLVPKDWSKFVAFDWGSAKPFCAQWWTIVQDDYTTPEGVLLPRGYMLCYREWYGCKYEAGMVVPDTGLRMVAEEVGRGIKERTDEKINFWVADPAVFKEDGGPSHAERMGLPFIPADNARVTAYGHMGGWDQMRSRMIGTRTHDDNGVLQEDGVPMMGYFNTCVDSIRTIPTLQHDPNRAEDLDTSSEDHAADTSRYACMSRPWRSKPKTSNVIETDLWGRRKRQTQNWKIA
jgi:hypothetical protein